MRPTIGIFSNFCRSYKQNKGIHAILEKVQQPVLHHGKKMRFIKKAPYRFFCNLLQWIYTSNGHVKLQKKSQLSQNEHEGMDSEQCVFASHLSTAYLNENYRLHENTRAVTQIYSSTPYSPHRRWYVVMWRINQMLMFIQVAPSRRFLNFLLFTEIQASEGQKRSFFQHFS